MSKIYSKFITITCLIFLISCGYNPMMVEKDYNFEIQIEKSIGDKDVNKYIKKDIERLDGNIKFNLIVDSKKEKIIVSKDNKGNPSILEMIINVNFKIKSEDQIILERNLVKSTTYNNITDKFELNNFEESLTKNLSKNIANSIISSVFSLIK